MILEIRFDWIFSSLHSVLHSDCEGHSTVDNLLAWATVSSFLCPLHCFFLQIPLCLWCLCMRSGPGRSKNSHCSIFPSIRTGLQYSSVWQCIIVFWFLWGFTECIFSFFYEQQKLYPTNKNCIKRVEFVSIQRIGLMMHWLRHNQAHLHLYHKWNIYNHIILQNPWLLLLSVFRTTHKWKSDYVIFCKTDDYLFLHAFGAAQNYNSDHVASWFQISEYVTTAKQYIICSPY